MTRELTAVLRSRAKFTVDKQLEAILVASADAIDRLQKERDDALHTKEEWARIAIDAKARQEMSR